MHALFISSKQSSLRKMEQILDQTDRAISRDHGRIVSRGGRIMQKEQLIALNVIRHMLGKTVYGYFDQWKSHTQQFKLGINSKIKHLILQLYLSKMKKAFYLWRRGLNHRYIKWAEHNNMIHEETVEEFKVMNYREKQRTEVKASLVGSQQRKTMIKVLCAMLNRKAREGLYQWRKAMAVQHIKEDGACLIILRYRQRRLSSYFNTYKQCYLDYHANLLMAQRLEDFQEMQNKRKMRQIYQSWCAFLHNYDCQKSKLRILMKKIINYKKHRGLKRWKAGCLFKSEFLLQVGQDSLVEALETKH